MHLKDINGTVIKPVKVGKVESTAIDPTVKRSTNDASAKGFARANCEDNSWIADSGREDYTRPADSSQVVVSGVAGPQTVTISKTRTATYTSTLDASIGFEDLIGIGLSFEQSFSESLQDTQSREFNVPEGQTGDVAFTPYLRCSTGMSVKTGLHVG